MLDYFKLSTTVMRQLRYLAHESYKLLQIKFPFVSICFLFLGPKISFRQSFCQTGVCLLNSDQSLLESGVKLLGQSPLVIF